MTKVKPFNIQPNSRIGHYRVIESIGRGWEAEVYKVVEVPTDAVRVIKLFRTDELDSIRHLIHIARYYEHVRITNHFPVYYHFGQWFLDDDNGCWYLVFEFIDGTCLKDLIDQNKHSKQDIFFALASALADIHEHAYAVGDFDTLQNVFMSVDKDNLQKIVFVDCYTGEPDYPNTDYRGDCLELVAVSEIFGPSKPSRVEALITEIQSRKRFGSKTLRGILNRYSQ